MRWKSSFRWLVYLFLGLILLGKEAVLLVYVCLLFCVWEFDARIFNRFSTVLFTTIYWRFGDYFGCRAVRGAAQDPDVSAHHL